VKIISYIEKDTETGLFIGIAPSVPGAYTQAATIEEVQKNLVEVIELCLQELTEQERQALPEFIAVQEVEVSL